MVCGLCHREEQDHSESTSGPTRCKYETHRENCPGGFKNNCDLHKNKLEEEKLEPKDEKDTANPGDSSHILTGPGSSPQNLAEQLQSFLGPEQLGQLQAHLQQTSDSSQPGNTNLQNP